MGFQEDLARVAQDPAIRSLAERRAGSRELAEDALQETFQVVARLANPERIEDLRAFFRAALIREIDHRSLDRDTAFVEDLVAVSDLQQELALASGRYLPPESEGEAHLLGQEMLARLDQEHNKLVASVPARSADHRRYRDTIGAAAKKILRLLLEGPVTATDWNAVLRSEYPQWCDAPDLPREAIDQRLSRARHDIRLLLQAAAGPDEPTRTPDDTIRTKQLEDAAASPAGQSQRRSHLYDIPAQMRALGVTVLEYQILQLLTERLSNREIAARLHLSTHTVENRIASLLTKTGQPDRFALGELGLMAANRTSAVPRLYVSASGDLDLRPLLDGLKRRGAEPYVLSDVAPLGAEIVQSLRVAIQRADRVLVVLGDAPAPNPMFEAGLALGLGKSLLIIASPGATMPADLAGQVIARARPHDLDAINFALDQVLQRSLGDTRRSAQPGGRPLGTDAVDGLLAELSVPGVTEMSSIDVLVEAIEASGSVAVVNPERDSGFDLGVWSDDLESIGGNPLLVEVKRSLVPGTVDQALRSLADHPGARLGLVVYLEPSAGDRPQSAAELDQARFPVLVISLQQLIRHMASASFAEVVRGMRNRSAHGLRPS